MNSLKNHLESIYRKYNRKEFVSHDPLIFLYDYPQRKDREIVALIASSLAYGRVSQILESVKEVLKPLGRNPRNFIMNCESSFFENNYTDFRYRFTCGKDLEKLFLSIKKTLENYETLENLFLEGMEKHASFINALDYFVSYLSNGEKAYLLPSPQRGSACKRLNLFLRWMIRKDEVDPGGWNSLNPSDLIVPLDTHMLKTARELKLTSAKQGNMKTALEITDAFKKINPEDPVKYDFALTRPGILGKN